MNISGRFPYFAVIDEDKVYRVEFTGPPGYERQSCYCSCIDRSTTRVRCAHVRCVREWTLNNVYRPSDQVPRPNAPLPNVNMVARHVRCECLSGPSTPLAVAPESPQMSSSSNPVTKIKL